MQNLCQQKNSFLKILFGFLRPYLRKHVFTNLPYNYASLATNGYVQVGYYKLSALETQKVDLTDYVSNTDYANSTNAGVIKTSSAGGISVDSQDGVASIVQSTTSEIDARTQNHKPITPNNLEYAVKSVVGGHTILTQAQYDTLVSGNNVDSNTYYYIVEE